MPPAGAGVATTAVFHQLTSSCPTRVGRVRAAGHLDRHLHGGAVSEPSSADRRAFLLASGRGLAGAWLLLQLPACRDAAQAGREAAREGRPFVTLTQDEGRELAAVAERILPSDETPGAREAGAIHFMDQALAGFAAFALEPIREGLPELREAARRRAHAEGDAEGEGEGDFSRLPASEQDELLREREGSPFFRVVRFLTVAGVFSSPEHGGNRDGVGWKLIDFADPGAWRPPFGHYDAEAT